MLYLIKLIVYRLWAITTVTIFWSLLVFWFYGVITSLLVLSIGSAGILYNAQDLLLYFPNDPADSRVFVLQPSNFKLPHESIKLKTKDGLKIHLFLIKQVNSKNVPTIVYFHGNAGNMGQRLPNVTGFYHKLNVNILMVEYRGYGLSEGSPSESGLYIDAYSALEYIFQRPDVDVNKIILFGRSLGGAIAIDAAASHEFRGKLWALIVENTFTSIPDMAKVLLRWRCLPCLPMFVHKNKFISISKMPHVVTPTLIISGSDDLLVPPSMSSELYRKSGAVVKKLSVLSGGHNDTWISTQYYPELEKFIASLPSLSTAPYYDEKQSSVHVV